MSYQGNIRLVKGSYNLTFQTTSSSEDIRNDLQVVPPVQVAQNQSEGAKIPKVVDFLKIQETFQIGISITKTSTQTAQQVKQDLKDIAKGAKINGAGPITLYYEDQIISVYIQSIVIKKVFNGVKDNYSGYDSAEYNAVITFLQGEAVQ